LAEIEMGFLAKFRKGGSEKGNTRKYTEKWVTRWKVLFWGNYGILRCFTKRILVGEFEMRGFLCFTRVST
jgi:hypothetical protein